jgi:hypothetical protein
LRGESAIWPLRSPPRQGRYVGGSFIQALRKPVHESPKTSVLGLKRLHLEQGGRGQTAIAFAPSIKSARRYVGCAANFGNGDTRIGFVQKVQNLAVGMLRASHRPYAFMCHRQSFKFWIVGPLPQVSVGAARLRLYLLLAANPLRLHLRKDFLSRGAERFPRGMREQRCGPILPPAARAIKMKWSQAVKVAIL